MVKIQKTRTQPTTFYKVKAHIKIDENEQANTLAKIGAKKRYSIASKTYQHAHTTPFYFHKDTTHKRTIYLNSTPANTWATQENNYSLEEKYSLQLHILYVTQKMQTHGFTYF